MRWFVTALCVISVAALPTGVKANTGSEAVSTKPIVIAYIPERLQLRALGQQHTRTTSPKLARETEVPQLADASGGLSWEMWPPEPSTAPQPKLQVEYVTPSPEEAARRRKRKIAIGVVVPVVVVGAIVGGVLIAGAMEGVRRMEF